MKPQDQYHTGLVVDDVSATMRWFTDVAGYVWCEPFEGEQIVQLPTVDRPVTQI